MVSPYLLRVISKPTKVDDETWIKWYIEEHVPDLIDSKTATRAAFYTAYDDYPLSTKTPKDAAQTTLGDSKLNHTDLEPPNEKRFLAMYQTDFPEPLETEEIKSVRLDSEMLPGKTIRPCAEWDLRVYKLVESYDPKGLGEVPSPYLLNVQVTPGDGKDDDYSSFYHDEHLMMLSKVPGYRRSQRYELTSTIRETPKNVPRYMAVHEWDSLDALDGPELREADASPNTIRVFGEAKMVNVRGFKLVKGFGFTNSE